MHRGFCRYSDQFIKKILEKMILNIKIKTYGYGPFVASYAIMFDYLKFIPLVNNLIFTIFYFLIYVLIYLQKLI